MIFITETADWKRQSNFATPAEITFECKLELLTKLKKSGQIYRYSLGKIALVLANSENMPYSQIRFSIKNTIDPS